MTLALPKPGRRVKVPRPLKRGARPRAKMPKALGDHRERSKYANDLWRHLIYQKEPSGICPRCKARRWHDAAHGWAKGPHPALRFELDNGIPLCRPCHRRVDYDHHEKEQLWRGYIGNQAYERLRLMAMARSRVHLDVAILFLESLTMDSKRAR